MPPGVPGRGAGRPGRLLLWRGRRDGGDHGCFGPAGIPASQTQLAENAVPAGAREAREYTGPCPPSGPAHHYRFTLYALGRSPEVPQGADPRRAITAIQAAATAQGQLVGTFKT